jgi:hypothetical protein
LVKDSVRHTQFGVGGNRGMHQSVVGDYFWENTTVICRCLPHDYLGFAPAFALASVRPSAAVVI